MYSRRRLRKRRARTPRRRQTRRVRGGGKDGCTIPMKCGYIAKYITTGLSVNWTIQTILKTIDAERARFIWYDRLLPPQCREETLDACTEELYTEIVYMPYAGKDVAGPLTKTQKAYLRQSVQILHKAGITHNDLVGNVLIAEDGLPRIIDWEDARQIPTLPVVIHLDSNDEEEVAPDPTGPDMTALRYYGAVA